MAKGEKMDRITREHVERQVRFLNIRLGKPTERFHADRTHNISQEGHLFLDHGPCGFRIAEIDNEQGGERHPLGDNSGTLRQCWVVLRAVHGLLDQQEMGFPNWTNKPIMERQAA